MTHITLDHLAMTSIPYTTSSQISPSPIPLRRSRYGEMMRVGIVLSISFVVGMVFTNFGIFQAQWMEYFGAGVIPSVATATASQTQINNTFVQPIVALSGFPRPSFSWHLLRQLRGFKFNFNTLPPDNRLMIPSLGVNVPIVDVKFYTTQKLEEGDFHKELAQWVVKYPMTPTPGQTGNILIFGHTSDYRRNNNTFGQVFSKIPKLHVGSVVKMVRWGQVYQYEIIEKVIKDPKAVAGEYEKYKDGQYVTLVGCYPIGTDSRRIMLIGKMKKSDSLAMR